MAGSLKVAQFIMLCWPGLSSHLSACQFHNGGSSITCTSKHNHTHAETCTHKVTQRSALRKTAEYNELKQQQLQMFNKRYKLDLSTIVTDVGNEFHHNKG